MLPLLVVLVVGLAGSAPVRADTDLRLSGGMDISAYQPDPGGGGEEDSTENSPEIEPKVDPGANPPTPPPQPKPNLGFSIPDSSRAGADSTLQQMNNPASVLPPPAAATGSSGSPVKSRRGVLGIHPAALLVGLVALHIFIVSVVAK
jgi:hypothetical protein